MLAPNGHIIFKNALSRHLCRFAEPFKQEVAWQENQKRHPREQKTKPGPFGHPRLSCRVAHAENVVDIHRRFRVGQDGAWTGHQKEADKDQSPSGQCPRPKSAAVVSDPRDQKHQQEREPPVEEGQAAKEEGKLRVEHVVRHAGQVEADPSRVNLTAFELFFQERRPFFIEGNNTLNFPLTDFNSNNLFYSRRIGRAPQGSVATGTMENALNTAIANSSALLDEAVVQLKSINYPKFSESTEANTAAVAAVTQYKADFLLKLDANGVGKTSCLTKINDISPNLAKFRGEYSAAPTGPKRDQAFMDLQNAQLQANNMIGRIQNGERFVTSMITTDISAVNSALTSYKDNTKDADKEKAVTAAIQELTSHFDSTKASTYVMPDPCK